MRVAFAVSVAFFLFTTAAFAGPNTWTTSGPSGGTIWDIAIDPSVPSTLYAATEGSLYKSTDSGATWNHLAGGPNGDIVSGVEIASSSTIYVSTYYSGVWKTVNGGTTWNQVNNGYPTRGFQQYPEAATSLSIDPNSPSTLYVGGYSFGVFKTTDGGATWNDAGSYDLPYAAVMGLAVDPRNSQIVYAALFKNTSWSDGVYRSTDGGGTWTAVNTGLTSSSGYLMWDVEIDATTNPSTIYVASSNNGVARSTNGTSWTKINTNYDGGSIPFLTAYSIKVDPGTPSTLYAGVRTRLLKSTDGGATWYSSMTGLSGTHFGAVAIDPTNGSKLYAGNNSSLFRSTTAGASWSESASGINSLTMDSISRDSGTGALFAGGRDGVYRSDDNGTSWSRLGTALIGYTPTGVAARNGVIYTLLLPNGCRMYDRGGYFAKSTDNGANWTIADLVMGGEAQSLVLHPTNANILYVTSKDDTKKVMKTVDGGATWTNVTGTASVSSFGAPLAIHPTNPDILYVGGNDGVYKTTNGGTSWTKLTDASNTVYHWYQITSIALDPADPNHVLAGSIVFLYESHDGGANWTFTAPFDLETVTKDTKEELYVRSIVFGPANTIYLATRLYGVVRSTDGGDTWTEFNTGMFNTHLSAMVAGANGNLHAASEGSSVFNFSIATPIPTPVLTATASGTTNVALSWTGDAAMQYDIERSSANSAYVLVTRVTGLAYNDGSVASNTTYLYRVRPAGSAVNSNVDHTTTIVFADDPLSAGTGVKAAHLTELRTGVNAMRAAVGLGASAWTDPTPAGVTIKVAHVTELRSGLTAALAALGKSLTVTDSSLSGTAIRAIHWQELRNAMR